MKRLAFALLLALTACGPSFTAITPPGFVELDNEYDLYDYRATTADGLVIAVREVEHDPKGEPAFWLKAIQNKMRDQGGYALLDTKQVKTDAGLSGTQMRFGLDMEGDKPHLYLVTLFVTEKHLFILEAGGTKELITTHAKDIDAAIRGFKGD